MHANCKYEKVEQEVFSGICQRLWISAFYLSCLGHQSAVIVLAYCADMAQIWIISDDSVIKDAHNKIWTF